MAANVKSLSIAIVILQCYLAIKVNGATGEESITISNPTGPGILDVNEQDGRKQLTVDSGDSVSLTCKVVYTGNYQVSNAAWYGKGTYLTQSGDLEHQDSDKYSISSNHYGSTFVDYIFGISSVTTEDAGEYRCEGANNKKDIVYIVVRESSTPDPVTPSVTIVKTQGPGSIVEKDGGGKQLTVNKGDTITLQCTVRDENGLPYGLWSWKNVGLTYNDTLLHPGSTQFSINGEMYDNVASFSLGIRGITRENAGEYRCQGNHGNEDSVDLVVSDNFEPVTSPVIPPKLIKKQTTNVEMESCAVISPRRYDIVDLGSSCRFRGWVDVQGQGAPNDYCRVISNGGQEILACALAGSLDENGYTSPNAFLDWFDAGHTDTWYMRDENNDGRDDYCRCVGIRPDTVISCMQAGKLGFIGNDDFQITNSTGCHYNKVNPYFGVP